MSRGPDWSYLSDAREMMEVVDSLQPGVRFLVNRFPGDSINEAFEECNGVPRFEDEIRKMFVVLKRKHAERQEELLKLEVITEEVATAFKRAVGRGR